MHQTDLFGHSKGHATPVVLPVLDRRRRGTTFIAHDVLSLLNSPESTGMNFWSINPYVGCEIGCSYCYARYAHQYVIERSHAAGHISSEELASYRSARRWEVFETKIFVKERDNVLRALDRDLVRLRARHQRGDRRPLVIGTATDPYQPAERRFAITRVILERLEQERRRLIIGIISKSALITRDIELLRDLGRRHHVTVYVSLIATDPELIRLFEARSPMPRVRLHTMQKLIDAGINTGAMIAPILPGITDSTTRLNEVASAVRQAGGRFIQPAPLRLAPNILRGFLPVIERHFPSLAERYRQAYHHRQNVSPRYKRALMARFRRVAHAHDLPVGDPTLDELNTRDGEALQLGLWERL